MNKLRSFTSSVARPLPVFILADVSGSMSVDGKIAALNTALREMVASCADEEGRAQIQLSIITIGAGGAKVHVPLTPAKALALAELSAGGGTPMGAAFDVVRELIEDRSVVSGRAYTPAIVLVSDGQPNDEWQAPLSALHGAPRAAKAQRFALGVGDDADAGVLRQFLNDPEGRVYAAHDAGQIQSFFRWVTMSVTARSRSANPNVAPVAGAIEFEPMGLDILV